MSVGVMKDYKLNFNRTRQNPTAQFFFFKKEETKNLGLADAYYLSWRLRSLTTYKTQQSLATFFEPDCRQRLAATSLVQVTSLRNE
jgi:hypothetical protein